MASSRDPSTPFRPPSLGFVVAMRATLITTKGSPWHEWIIVSRWGIGGKYLSFCRTFVPAPRIESAPISLQPRQAALARLLRLPPAAARATFLLARRLPPRIPLAGEFAPAEGYLQLHGADVPTRLVCEGRFAPSGARCALRLEADRAPWIGECVEGVPHGHS